MWQLLSHRIFNMKRCRSMKKILLVLCITMNLICMMLAVFLFMMRNSGLAVFVDAGNGQPLNYTALIVVLAFLALLFAYLATRLVVGKK